MFNKDIASSDVNDVFVPNIIPGPSPKDMKIISTAIAVAGVGMSMASMMAFPTLSPLLVGSSVMSASVISPGTSGSTASRPNARTATMNSDILASDVVSKSATDTNTTSSDVSASNVVPESAVNVNRAKNAISESTINADRANNDISASNVVPESAINANMASSDINDVVVPNIVPGPSPKDMKIMSTAIEVAGVGAAIIVSAMLPPVIPLAISSVSLLTKVNTNYLPYKKS